MNVPLQTQVKAPPPSSFTPMRSGLLRRTSACCGAPSLSGECDACRTKRPSMARRASTEQAQLSEVPPVVHDVLRSPGQRLDAKTLSFMESRFGHDFSQVRVHRDEKAAESARTLNALAYTVGRDVVFGTRQYLPETVTGKRLLAHELMHVVQQRHGEPQPLSRVASAAHEQEAHRAAAAIASPSLGVVPRTTAGPVRGLQCLDPSLLSPTFTPDADILIKDITVRDKKYLPCGEFDWGIRWQTSRKDGYIVQEIHAAETIQNCDETPYKEADPEKVKNARPPHFWEAWSVNADGRFYPDNGPDDWKQLAHPNTKGSWEVNANVYWAGSLDPDAGFEVMKDVKRSLLPSTVTAPKNLGAALLTRRAAGRWNCCGGSSTHDREE
jgi:hypothetical protein